ncbi:bifunctional methylenetetrahydrofolate dehydrogenase/methenyltetrahydrofolate cyclohydrolase FolD [Hyphomicrobium methylovorum]|uniref:bifunctional methylenetetrahydrofolate dehydrogenase/methenyltetrahydrofolate cyclohydrolase FolD n=1 Tax=Hyphomicrobium methylovorum TaxID=84 RepID=UPI0015E63477|nr:bifunctional methylenetetrahydrofolate dehydrogenase/methenyltetrahydrofolate cyclohydrolase FolD [Hyphomicrobium methylovorum]MBA2127190.1 bifunctional methylenetetrahydrofolate dehydrogenase/methenyltetrahydrofolate cyclohydrolase FolD [Hyphomicrobium methylovorum]
MTAKIIDGKSIAANVRHNCRSRVELLKRSSGITPGLAVFMVGEDPASAVYVRKKIQACADVGIQSHKFLFSHSDTQDVVIDKIRELSADPRIHGILVQLPLPKHFDLKAVLGAIDQEKDIDGFHLYNVGGLVVGSTVFPPCTPYGVMLLLDNSGVEIAGRNAVVVGASNIVGKPMALMLMQREATVSVCHAKTRDLAQFTILADILIVAAGCPNLITGPMVKSGAVVIDVGINRLPNGQLVGDCDFEAVSKRASMITPVPGGVGPMTVTMLLVNTISSAMRSANVANADFALADL